MHKRRWLARVRDDIREKGLSLEERYDRGTWRRISSRSTPHKSEIEMKGKKM